MADTSLVKRIGDEVVIEIPEGDKSYLAKLPGVERGSGNLLRKRFPGHRIRLGAEIASTVEAHRSGNDVLVLGVSGYSDLNAERCRDLNVRPGAYENALVGMVRQCIRALRTRVNNPILRMVYGSSEGGVDGAIQLATRQENVELLGISCPAYLWYVDNSENGPIICVAEDEEEYCNIYVKAIDILFAANGGKVSYRMDIRAATEYGKRVVVIDVLRVLGARIQGFDTAGNILDAAAALRERLAIISTGVESTEITGYDLYTTVAERLVDRVIGYARELVSPGRAYGNL